MIKCPKCGNDDLDVYFSVCKDPECCGIEDRVDCNKCDFYYETFCDDKFEEKLLELGMTKDEIIKERR